MSEEQQPADQTKQFLDTLITLVGERCQQTLVELTNKLVGPILQRLDRIGTAQVVLANGLRANRRDRNATEMAKVALQSYLARDTPVEGQTILQIAMMAYELAQAMEEHALVAELQSEHQIERARAAFANRGSTQ